jgi:cell division protein FtsL
VSAVAAGESRRRRTEKRKLLMWHTEAQAVLTWGVIMVLAALVGAIYLLQASRIASVGREVQTLQYQLNETKRVNSEIEREIAEAESLDRLKEEALKLGFVRATPEDVAYVVVLGVPSDSAPIQKAEVDSRPEPFETIGEALLAAVQDGFGALQRGESR